MNQGVFSVSVIFLHVIDLFFFNETDFMVFSHVYADNDYTDPFKVFSQGK